MGSLPHAIVYERKNGPNGRKDNWILILLVVTFTLLLFHIWSARIEIDALRGELKDIQKRQENIQEQLINLRERALLRSN